MRRIICFLVVLAALTIPARALSQDLRRALPEGAEELMEDLDTADVPDLSNGLAHIAAGCLDRLESVLRQRLRGAAAVLLVVVLCGAVESFQQGALGERTPLFLSAAGALAITALTAGSLGGLIGLGRETVGELDHFAAVLLPALAAATAASGAVTAASFRQVTAMGLAGVLLRLIDRLLLPMTYLYIGALTAACCLPDHRLSALAEGLKGAVTSVLKASLLAFTVYLSAGGVIAGAVDSAAVKAAKTAVSTAVPVVGGIIAEASESVLAGAGLLKNTVGIFGMLGILAGCAYPFLHLAVQYLLYKLTAILASAVGMAPLCRLIDGLGGAFGLVLGMVGSCAMLLLVAVVSFVAAVTP